MDMTGTLLKSLLIYDLPALFENLHQSCSEEHIFIASLLQSETRIIWS